MTPPPAAHSHRSILLGEFLDRKRKNPSYSLTAFAKSIGISTPSISQILSGKRPLSKATAKKIVERCLFEEEKRKRLLESAVGVQTKNPNVPEYADIESEEFWVMADWRHYAILSLSDLPKNRASYQWIAEELDIPISAARDAFDRLLKLGMIERRGTGYAQSVRPFSMKTGVQKQAMRHAHHALLNKAKDTLDDEETKLELFSSITMAVNESQLDEAREKIRKFRHEMCAFLESGKKERVYTLAVQLFPLSKKTTRRYETLH